MLQSPDRASVEQQSYGRDEEIPSLEDSFDSQGVSQQIQKWRDERLQKLT